VYSVTTVAYAVRRDFLLGASSMFEGNVRAVSVPQERAIDIDTEFDLTVAECLIARRIP
jgi:N-acylneuraminate cytidylyltransferase